MMGTPRFFLWEFLNIFFFFKVLYKGSVNFFYKGPENKYFKFSKLYSVHHEFRYCAKKTALGICKQMDFMDT